MFTYFGFLFQPAQESGLLLPIFSRDQNPLVRASARKLSIQFRLGLCLRTGVLPIDFVPACTVGPRVKD
jgi:hypothetical protein